MAETSPIRFVDELPDCCAGKPLRLTPASTFLELGIEPGRSDHWELGLDTWLLRIGVSWDEELGDLAEALSAHLGRDLDDDEFERMAAAHGVVLEPDGDGAIVGEAVAVLVKFDDEYASAAGRQVIHGARGLLLAADEAAGNLINLVAAIADADAGDGWCTEELAELVPGSEYAGTLLILESAWVTPTLRGNGLGSWACAQAVAMLGQIGTVVAMKAAPLQIRDAVPDAGPTGEQNDLTPLQSVLWKGEQARLAEQWRTQLGFEPLPSDPTILVYNTDLTNQSLLDVLARHA